MKMPRFLRKRTKPAEVITTVRGLTPIEASGMATACTYADSDGDHWARLISKLTHWGIIK